MTIIRLRDAADPRLAAYTQLTNHQLRNALDPACGVVIVESEIALRVALEEGLEPLSFLLAERGVRALEDVLEAHPDVCAFVLPPGEAERLTGYAQTRGVLCAMTRPQLPSLEAVLEASRHLVVLEGITDTSNVGALFRNAAALGADGLVVTPTCADPYTRRSVRVSMGNVFRLPWTRAQGMGAGELVGLLRARGFRCLALALDERAIGLREARERYGNERLALFFGSEGTGLTDDVLRACERSVIIPMARGVDSLNVAASSAIALWELFS